MRKYGYLLCLLVIGLFLVPKFVLAEDLPREGVYYFLTYPDGEEVITENYQEAEEPEEKLLFTDVTDENGEVILDNLMEEGELRIVQELPEGYSTNRREITLDLSEADKNVEFVNFKTIPGNSNNNNDLIPKNPETGQSLLFIVILAIVILVAVKTLKGDTSKQSLLLIPILLLGALAFKVNAANNRVVIAVTDKEGNRLSGITVRVYAYPARTQAYPTVIFNASEGYFFDGTQIMYAKIPTSCSGSCNLKDLFDGMDSEERGRISANIVGAYRDGYHPKDSDAEGLEYPNELVNGSEVKIKWEQGSDAKLVNLNGNGGYFDFYGKHLTNITNYESSIHKYAYGFQSRNQYSIGADTTSECSAYGENGIRNKVGEWDNNVDTYYTCWNEKPDGIYVNGNLFLGNRETCFHHAAFPNFNNELQFNNYKFRFVNLSDSDVQLSLLRKKKATSIGGTIVNFGGSLGSAGSHNGLLELLKTVSAQQDEYEEYGVETLEIIENGQAILSLTAADIVRAEDIYSITNAEKKTALVTYLNELLTNPKC